MALYHLEETSVRIKDRFDRIPAPVLTAIDALKPIAQNYIECLDGLPNSAFKFDPNLPNKNLFRHSSPNLDMWQDTCWPCDGKHTELQR